MLHEFLTSHRDELIERCRQTFARFAPAASSETIEQGVPLFLEQLTSILRREQLSSARPASGELPLPLDINGQSAIGRSAAVHGTELLRLGYTLEQVVHGYGDVCQAITGLAVEQTLPISTDEFRTLNRCLDNAIADAVTAFSSSAAVARSTEAESQSDPLSAYAAEQQRLVDIATHAFSAITSGSAGVGGATAALLVYTLNELRALPERKPHEIRQPDPLIRQVSKQKP